MFRTELDHEIHLAIDQILILGSMVEHAVYRSVRALKDHDFDTSRAIIAEDRLINFKRFEIETSVMVDIATQQPIAHDLRLLASILDLCTELERVGDYAKGIAIINLRSDGLDFRKLMNDIYYMSEMALDMFHRALSAFIREDADSARAIAGEDEVIDALYENIHFAVIDLITKEPTYMEHGNYVLWAAHNIERVGDRVTNICERIIYIVTGERAELVSAPREFRHLPHEN